MSSQVLVAYATKHGATQEIAEKIGEVMRKEGLWTDVLRVDEVRDVSPYVAVILGSAVYMGAWRGSAAKFLRANADALAERMVWLFSSGPLGEGDPVDLLEGWRFPEGLQEVAERIGPRDMAVFHGVMDMEKLGPVNKWMMEKFDSPVGDFRQWDMIVSWATGIAHTLKEKVGEAGA